MLPAVPETSSSSRAQVIMCGLLRAAGTVVAVSSLVGFLGPFWWFFDLFSHFRVQYAAGLLPIVVMLLLGRKLMSALVFGLITIINLATIIPLYQDPTASALSVTHTYRAMLANVNTRNKQYPEVTRVIGVYDPDLVILLEVNATWLSALGSLQESHPYSVTAAQEDDYGIALFSKIPLGDSAVVVLGPIDSPSIWARLDLNDRSVTVLGTHLLAPSGRDHSAFRNAQLAAILGFFERTSPPVLVLGDLNVTPWSSHFHRLLAEARLRNCTAGRGVQPTWPAFLPLFYIPIDHCLYSSGIRILDKHVGPDIGSDHYPIIVDFALTTTLPGDGPQAITDANR